MHSRGGFCSCRTGFCTERFMISISEKVIDETCVLKEISVTPKNRGYVGLGGKFFQREEIMEGGRKMSETTSIISIGREFGSGGRQIGEELAKKLGIKYYDKELLDHAAEHSGLCKELFENHDEKPTNSFLYSLVMDSYSLGYSAAGFTEMPMNHKVFLAQFETIRHLAEEGPCVMVGRCADYALADNPNLFSVFIHAGLDSRIARISAKYLKSPKESRDAIQKMDKSRSSYYNYYTNKKWGSAQSYDLCIDSSKLGIDGSVDTIICALKIFEEKKNAGKTDK